MSVSVSMPQLGESVTEGTVTRWLKKEGERVEADEPLLEVSTDKVDTEIPSPAAGVLRDIAVGEDETVEVGAQLAVIEEGADARGGRFRRGGRPCGARGPVLPRSRAGGRTSAILRRRAPRSLGQRFGGKPGGSLRAGLVAAGPAVRPAPASPTAVPAAGVVRVAADLRVAAVLRVVAAVV